MEQVKRFVFMWTFIGWRDISLGFHICLGELYFDIHVPFGWLRIGWEDFPKQLLVVKNKRYGLKRERR